MRMHQFGQWKIGLKEVGDERVVFVVQHGDIDEEFAGEIGDTWVSGTEDCPVTVNDVSAALLTALDDYLATAGETTSEETSHQQFAHDLNEVLMKDAASEDLQVFVELP